MAKVQATDTVFSAFCKLKMEFEKLEYSIKITPDNVQQQIKVETVIEAANKLKTQIENQINNTENDEI